MSKGPRFLFEIERSSRWRVVEIERVHCMNESVETFGFVLIY